jgi:hypothetical protein
VLDGKPDRPTLLRVRAAWLNTATDLLQRDFGAAEKYLAEYERLVPLGIDRDAPKAQREEQEVEARGRRIDLLRWRGQGREAQGRLAEALADYLALVALVGDELFPVAPGHRVRADIWVAGRIEQLLEKLTPAERKRFEEEVRSKLKQPAPGQGDRR